MRLFFVVTASLIAIAAPTRAEVELHVTIGLPAVLPPMVIVEPGVQVVSGLEDEVYFVDGWYWLRRGPQWYRTRDHRRSWVWVTPRGVPVMLARIPPGRYRHLDHERWKREHREDKEARKAERARWKAERESAKREKHGRGRGKGHGRDDRDD